MSETNIEIEKLYFNLFPTRKDEAYMRMLLVVVFEHIRANGKVSQSRLCYSVSQLYPYTEEDVMTAISALVNPLIFGVVARFDLSKHKNMRTPNVITLSVKNERMNEYMSWYNSVLDQYSELKKISA